MTEETERKILEQTGIHPAHFFVRAAVDADGPDRPAILRGYTARHPAEPRAENPFVVKAWPVGDDYVALACISRNYVLIDQQLTEHDKERLRAANLELNV